ncbi:MAG: hypothetical protein M3365_10525, partial [Gemmatimonadota bacterium]|nr:hypothetical protein [Gemmatimonadota bacterium]
MISELVDVVRLVRAPLVGRIGDRVLSFPFLRGPLLSFIVVAAFIGCAGKKETALVIETAAVERRSIVLSAQANGVVEPVTVIEVKSRASGQITSMPVDVGSVVK